MDKRKDIPENWIQITFIPKEKYMVIETDEGYEIFMEDDHGAFF